MTEDDRTTAETYEQFVGKAKRITNIETAANILQWDQEVYMPDGGVPARSQQLSTLSSIEHETLTGDEMGEFLAELRDADLTDEQAANVREIARQYDRMVRVPNALIEEISRTASEAFQAWNRAKENAEFETFAPKLEELVNLRREYARHIDPDADPYAVLFADYEPYIELDTVERILERLREDLVPLIDRIAESDVDPGTDVFEGTFPEAEQESLTRDILDLVGYDWNRGRLDTAPHPFSTGTPFDARVTTRYDESEPLGSMMSAIHEFGHARYTLGLPQEHYGTPLGKARDLTVHESQSRLWENHVGRSRAFWELALPIVADRFSAVRGATVDEVYGAVNRVYDDNPIRVDADELTYHLHIVLRFEIERELMAGSLDVAEVPHAWNDRMERFLGFRPETDAEGCLQDVHWSHGGFGYFPTYTLGSVLAAQLAASIEEDVPDLDGHVRNGRFDPLHKWLTDHVFTHGCRYPTAELIQVATGSPFRADDFLEYVDRKYSNLYDL